MNTLTETEMEQWNQEMQYENTYTSESEEE